MSLISQRKMKMPAKDEDPEVTKCKMNTKTKKKKNPENKHFSLAFLFCLLGKWKELFRQAQKIGLNLNFSVTQRKIRWNKWNMSEKFRERKTFYSLCVQERTKKKWEGRKEEKMCALNAANTFDVRIRIILKIAGMEILQLLLVEFILK